MTSTRRAFLASRIDTLRELRARAYELGDIWVSEHSRPDLGGVNPGLIQVSCWNEIRASKQVICVLDGSYGSDWLPSEISILETEIFMAMLSRLPIRVVRVEPFDPDPRLRVVLTLMKRLAPDSLTLPPVSRGRALNEIQRLLDSRADEPEKGLHGRLLAYLARLRALRRDRKRMVDDVRFLGGHHAPLKHSSPDLDLVDSLLEEAEAENVAPDQLARLWLAYRHLCSVPFTGAASSPFLPRWARLMSLWSSASAWYGLHGHIELGRLAASLTLRDIQTIANDRGEVVVAGASIHGTLGSVASEYHSIAKRAAGARTRRALRLRAVAFVNDALSRACDDPSGLLAIRGNIYLALLRLPSAVRDFEKVYAIRREAADPGRLGEAEVDLGLAWVATGRVRKGRRLLEAGVENLDAAGRTAFLVRALRKLATAQLIAFRRQDALATIARARTVAEAHGLDGQTDQLARMESWLRRRLPRLLPSDTPQ